MKKTAILFLVFLTAGMAFCAEKVKFDDAMASGIAAYTINEFRQAEKFFRLALKNAETPYDSARAKYTIAALNLYRPDLVRKEEGLKQLRELLDSASDRTIGGWSALALARYEHLTLADESPDYERVRKAYQFVVNRYSGTPMAEEAFVFQMATYLPEGKTEGIDFAVKSILAELKRNPSNRFAGRLHLLLRTIYVDRGKFNDACREEIEYIRKLKEENPDAEVSTEYWFLASVAEFKSGDFELARTYYKRLISEYPRDARCFGAELALKRMKTLEEELRRELTVISKEKK